MSIEFSEDTVGVWYVPLPESNWLASIQTKGDKTEIVYRLRHYIDDKIFDSEDKRNWYKMTTNEPVDYVVAATRKVAKKLATLCNSDVYELMTADFDSLSDFMDEFSKAPFIETRTEKLH